MAIHPFPDRVTTGHEGFEELLNLLYVKKHDPDTRSPCDGRLTRLRAELKLTIVPIRPISRSSEIAVMSMPGESIPPSRGVADGAASSFSAICAAARDGSSADLGELLESCRNYLLVIANHAVKEGLQAKVGASDLVQETFVEAQRIFNRFEGNCEEELRRWLARILEFKIGNTLKRYRGAASRDVRREVEWLDFPGEGTSPSSILRRNEDRERFQAAVAELPPDQQAAVRMRLEDSLAFEVIGVRLDRSTEAARKLYARAVLWLQSRLETQDD